MREKKQYYDTPLWDDSLTAEERIDYLLGEMTWEEKLMSLGTGNPEIPRLGVPRFGVGGEGAHGVQARHDQEYDQGKSCYTTVFPNPIGMSATWDEELIRQAGDVVGKEARALYHSGRHHCLSLWAPTVDMNRDPRWGRLEECYGEDPYLTGKMAGAYVEGMQGKDSKYLQCAATAKHFYANNMEEGRTYVSSSVDLRNKYEYYLVPFKKMIQEHGIEAVMTAYNEVNGVPCMLLEKDIEQLKKWGLKHVVCDGGDVNQTVNFHKYFSRHSETIAAGLKAHIDCFTDDIRMVSEAAGEAYDHGMITEEDVDEALRNYFGTMIRLGLFDREEKNPYAGMNPDVVACETHQALARKVTAESVVLLKNEGGLLPLPLEEIRSGRKKLAVIGPLGDVWYKGWYSGQPPYGVTPLEGVENALGEEVSVAYESGISEVLLQISEEKYLGILPDGRTVGVTEKSGAETFLIECWEGDKFTLRAKSSGKFLVMKDDKQREQKGQVTADSEEAFGWFVKEIFHGSGENMAVENGRKIALAAWDQTPLCIDSEGILRKMAFVPEWKQQLEVSLVVQRDGIAAAAETASGADYVLLCLGAHPMITCKEEIDRQNLELSFMQTRLAQAVYQENTSVILSLITSVPYSIIWSEEHIPAILTMAGGSMELGNGLADVLFGRENPAARLNNTWYASEKDLPPMADYDIIQGERTYQYFQGKPLYPFGHGLSYTRFGYEDFQVNSHEDSTNVECTGEIYVTNLGTMSGDEVVQIYYSKTESAVKRPKKKLVCFQRIKDIMPGERRRVTFEISGEELSVYDVVSGKMMLESGEYLFMAGASSQDIRCESMISLTGEERGSRDGMTYIPAECFDRAANHVLRRGHLSYQAVCSKNGTDPVEISYDNVKLKNKAEEIVLDFWREYACEISVSINGKSVGNYSLQDPFHEENPEEEKTTRVGEATGEGAFQAHQNWLARRREIGYREITVPLDWEQIPVNEEFTLTIGWTGKGKLCMFRFRETD